jgi:hypothetical protein
MIFTVSISVKYVIAKSRTNKEKRVGDYNVYQF